VGVGRAKSLNIPEVFYVMERICFIVGKVNCEGPYTNVYHQQKY
jgi:hypothetical protein